MENRTRQNGKTQNQHQCELFFSRILDPEEAASYSFHFLACCLEVCGETNVLTWPNENIGNNTLPLRVPLIMYLRLDTRRPL